MDPTLTRADKLVGQVLGEVDALPDVFTELEVNFFLLRRLLGVRTQVHPQAPVYQDPHCPPPPPPPPPRPQLLLLAQQCSRVA